MKPKKPKTRIAAEAPSEVDHLSTAEQQALEVGKEAEHASGETREDLIKTSKRLSEEPKQ